MGTFFAGSDVLCLYQYGKDVASLDMIKLNIPSSIFIDALVDDNGHVYGIEIHDFSECK